MSSRNQKKFNTIVKTALKNGWKEEDLKECMQDYLKEQLSDTTTPMKYSICSHNLAMFSKVIGNLQETSSSILLFTTEDECSDNALLCRCIICRKQIKMEVQPTVDISNLRRHLNDCHHHLADQILSVYPKMKNLLKDVQSDVFSHKNEEEGEDDTTLSIENFFSTKTMTARDIQIVQNVQREEEKDGLDVIDLTNSNPQPSAKQHSIPRNGLSIAERRQIKQVLTTVALGIPLTWSRKLNQVNEKIVNDLELILCPYDSMRVGLKNLRERMQRCIAQYLQQFDYINFCCDGWSVMKPDISIDGMSVCMRIPQQPLSEHSVQMLSC